VPDDVTAAYHDTVKRLLSAPKKYDDQGEIVSQVLELGPDALAKVREFAAKLEPRLGPGGDLEQIQDWASKATGAMVRIAGLLYLARAFEASESFEQGVITRRELDESEKIIIFFLSHALAAFRAMGMDASVGQARVLLNWIQKHQLAHFTRRDAQQKNRGTFKSPAEIDPALKILEDHGYIRTTPNAPTGGRPRPSFEVHPSAQKTQKHQKGVLH
jgi:hypothetical protein